MPIKQTLHKGLVPVHIFTDDIDHAALQLLNIAQLSIVHPQCGGHAGRRMSRSEAKRRFNRFDLAEQTAGIECRKDGGVVDEIPAAYKDIGQVMAHQTDLVEVVHTLRQVVCVKG